MENLDQPGISGIIEAVEHKEKKDKKTAYSFSLNSDVFEAYFNYGKKPSLLLLRNGTQIGIVDKPGGKVQFSVETGEQSPVNITVWIEGRISSWLWGRVQRNIGIEVNGRPVQHTLADPNTHIRVGKTWLGVLLAIFALKIGFQIFTGSIIKAGFYFIPLLITLAAIVKYKKQTGFALITGIVLSGLEFIDYITGLPGSGASHVLSLAFRVFRIIVLANLVNAFKWHRKEKAKTSV